MHLADGAQLPQSEGDVNHRRCFDQQAAAFAPQQVEVLQQVGGAVLKGGHLAARRRATRRVDIEQVVRLLSGQPLHAVGAVDVDVSLAEGFAVVLHQGAEFAVALHVVDMFRHPGKGQTVDPHAAREVGHVACRADDSCLIACGGFRRGLLAVQSGRVEELLALQQRRPFLPCRPQPLNLLHGSRHVNMRIPRGTQQQPRGILVLMRPCER